MYISLLFIIIQTRIILINDLNQLMNRNASSHDTQQSEDSNTRDNTVDRLLKEILNGKIRKDQNNDHREHVHQHHQRKEDTNTPISSSKEASNNEKSKIDGNSTIPSSANTTGLVPTSIPGTAQNYTGLGSPNYSGLTPTNTASSIPVTNTSQPSSPINGPSPNIRTSPPSNMNNIPILPNQSMPTNSNSTVPSTAATNTNFTPGTETQPSAKSAGNNGNPEMNSNMNNSTDSQNITRPNEGSLQLLKNLLNEMKKLNNKSHSENMSDGGDKDNDRRRPDRGGVDNGNGGFNNDRGGIKQYTGHDKDQDNERDMNSSEKQYHEPNKYRFPKNDRYEPESNERIDNIKPPSYVQNGSNHNNMPSSNNTNNQHREETGHSKSQHMSEDLPPINSRTNRESQMNEPDLLEEPLLNEPLLDELIKKENMEWPQRQIENKNKRPNKSEKPMSHEPYRDYMATNEFNRDPLPPIYTGRPVELHPEKSGRNRPNSFENSVPKPNGMPSSHADFSNKPLSDYQLEEPSNVDSLDDLLGSGPENAELPSGLAQFDGITSKMQEREPQEIIPHQMMNQTKKNRPLSYGRQVRNPTSYDGNTPNKAKIEDQYFSGDITPKNKKANIPSEDQNKNNSDYDTLINKLKQLLLKKKKELLYLGSTLKNRTVSGENLNVLRGDLSEKEEGLQSEIRVLLAEDMENRGNLDNLEGKISLLEEERKMVETNREMVEQKEKEKEEERNALRKKIEKVRQLVEKIEWRICLLLSKRKENQNN